MGNVLGTGRGVGQDQPQQQGNAADGVHWNIVAGQNDLNYPHSSQMFYFVLHGMIPLLGVVLFAYTAKRNEERQQKMEDTCVNLNQFMSAARKTKIDKAPTGWSLSKNDVQKLLEKLESDENVIMSDKIAKLQNYEQELEKILDIRCSRFKSHRKRDVIQDRLISDLTRPDNPLNDLNMYTGLKDIFRFDYMFCGQTKQDNGKLRQLYMQIWRLQTELNKYKAIHRRLQSNLDN